MDEASGGRNPGAVKILLVAAPAESGSIARALEPGCQVEHADPAGVVGRARVWRPDVVMMDVAEVDATAVVGALRRDPSVEDTAIVVLAGAEHEALAVAALEAGANDHVMKPFSPAALRARVRYALAVASTCRRLAAVQAELREVSRDKQERGDFINLAAHELRGPLTVATGYVSMLSEGTLGALSDEAQRVVPVVLEKLREMDDLIQELLETARLEEHTPELSTTLIDLHDLVDDCLHSLASRPHGRERIELDMEQRPLLIAGERPRMRAVVRNLIDNALKYSPNGGTVRVVGRADQGLHRATLEVSDTGVGIAPEDRRRLFQPFGRIVTEKTRDIDGTGLGLYLSRRLARLHGGDITMEPNAGGGSTFSLWLPLAGPRPGVTALGGMVAREEQGTAA